MREPAFQTQPPFTVGILGGGQLGRMTILAGRTWGWRFHVFEPGGAGSPAGQVADREVDAPWGDTAALEAFAQGLDLCTLEFENIPPAVLDVVARHCPVHPSPEVLGTCQHRLREKTFLSGHGFPCAPFREVSSAAELASALAELGGDCILKTAAFGYDGKGQLRLRPGDDPAAAWKTFGTSHAVLEQRIAFTGEYSVIVARTADGREAVYPLARNHHEGGILHHTVAPARDVPEARAQEARELGLAVARALDCVGLLAVELFLTDAGWLVNELAPRPHNSGHWTQDAAATSQFEQLLRAVSGLPLGATDALCPCVMLNLLGDRWAARSPTHELTHLLAAHPAAKLHLYGKPEARAGRKMGHVNLLHATRLPEG